MELPSTKYNNNTRSVSGTLTVKADDQVLNCVTASGACSITLLDIPANYWNSLYKLYIFDASNNAGTNNITITAPTGFKINNAQSITVNVNGGGVIVRIGNNTNYVATVVSNGSGSSLTVQKDSVTVGTRGRLNFVTGTDITLAVTDNSSNNSVDVTVSLTDTGWLDLQGFAWITAVGGVKPQYRIIGKTINFRGSLIVPLNNAGSVLTYSSELPYFDTSLVTPFTAGAGGVLLTGNAGNEGIVFNLGASVFQSASHLPDGTYIDTWRIGQRRVRTQGSVNKGVVYISTYSVIISSTGILTISTLFDAENCASAATSAPVSVYSSQQRFANSHAIAGQGILDYRTIETISTLNGNGDAASDLIVSISTPNTAGTADNLHNVSLDATLATQMGGFQVRLDGLKAYIS